MDSDVEPVIFDPRLRIVSRQEWGALPPLTKEQIKLPAHRMFFTMTNTGRCMSKTECVQAVRDLQQYYMQKKGMPDLPYSFLVGGDLRVYEGRGWGVKIREATEPMEQPTWKTGRVVIGYITRSNDNSKHMDRMIEKGYRLMNMGIDNNYLVDFNKHQPYRSVDFDNEIEVEKYEEVSRKHMNQCYQGFVPNDEVIFDSPNEERSSDFEMRPEDVRETGGDVFEEVEKELKERREKQIAELNEKIESIYGNSNENIESREKRVRSYGEAEYRGDYSEDHFQEETGSTSQLGHTSDGSSSGEMFKYPDWVYADEDWADDKKGKRINKKKAVKQHDDVSEEKQNVKTQTVTDELKAVVRELEKYRDCKTSTEHNADDSYDGQVQQSGFTNKPIGEDIKISEASGTEIARAVMGVGSKKHGVKKVCSNDDSKNIINGDKRAKRKTRKQRDQRFSKSNLFSKDKNTIPSSSSDEDPEKRKMIQDYYTQVKETERYRTSMGDYSPNDSDDDIHRVNLDQTNSFVGDCDGFKKDSTLNNLDNVSQHLENSRKEEVNNYNYSENVIETPNNSNNNIDSGQQEFTVSTKRNGTHNEIEPKQANRNLIFDHKKYMNKLNSTLIKKYISLKNTTHVYKKENNIYNGEGHDSKNTTNISNIGIADAIHVAQDENEEGNMVHVSGLESKSHLNIPEEAIDSLKLNENDVNINNLDGETADEAQHDQINNETNTQGVNESTAKDTSVHNNKEIVYQKRYPRKGAMFENEEEQKYYKDNLSRKACLAAEERRASDVDRELDTLIKEVYEPTESDSELSFDQEFGKEPSYTPQTITELEDSEIDPMDFEQ